jgi:predicted PurR-regulated permease PerM
MNGTNLRKTLFVVLFIALLVLVARLFYPFLTVLLWSGLLYVILVPVYTRLTHRRDGREVANAVKHLLAGLFSVLGVLLIVGPLTFLAISVLRQVGEITSTLLRSIERHPEWLDMSPNGTLGGFIYRATNGDLDLSSIDLHGELIRFLAGSTQRILGLSGMIIKNAAAFGISIAFMIFTLYFFFVDGGHLVHVLVGAIPIEKDYTRHFVRTLRDKSKQLLLGYLLVAVYQSVAAYAIFSLFHVRGPLVLAMLTGICSFIPMVGAGLVWGPVGIGHIIAGNLVGGIALLLISGFFISIMDNFLRPLFLRERLNIHPLLIFFSILGGLQLFGFNGIVLGPLILILFFAALGLYELAYGPAEGDKKGPPGERKTTEV